jgi:hypothetical protein
MQPEIELYQANHEAVNGNLGAVLKKVVSDKIHRSALLFIFNEGG